MRDAEGVLALELFGDVAVLAEALDSGLLRLVFIINTPPSPGVVAPPPEGDR